MKRLSVLFVMFCCLPLLYSQDAEQQKWYLISQQELSNIEKYKATSETEKQSWLLQVQKLNKQVNSLQQESTNLNNQLQAQRQTNKKLENSYNKLELEKSQAILSLNSEINTLSSSLNKYKSRFLIALIIITAETALIVIGVILKIKKIF